MCVHRRSEEKPAADAQISWWVTDSLVGSELEAKLDASVPAWIVGSGSEG